MIGQRGQREPPWAGRAELKGKQKWALVTHLGWSQDLGRVHSEQELLATPTAGQWEERAYSDQVSPLLL